MRNEQIVVIGAVNKGRRPIRVYRRIQRTSKRCAEIERRLRKTHPWVPIKKPAAKWAPMGTHAPLAGAHGPAHGLPWVVMGCHGLSWVVMGFHGLSALKSQKIRIHSHDVTIL
jgi:hypothetical protein